MDPAAGGVAAATPPAALRDMSESAPNVPNTRALVPHTRTDDLLGQVTDWATLPDDVWWTLLSRHWGGGL